MCVISISNGQILPVFRVKMNNKRRVLSLRSTHVTLVQSTRETGDINTHMAFLITFCTYT